MLPHEAEPLEPRKSLRVIKVGCRDHFGDAAFAYEAHRSDAGLVKGDGIALGLVALLNERDRRSVGRKSEPTYSDDLAVNQNGQRFNPKRQRFADHGRKIGRYGRANFGLQLQQAAQPPHVVDWVAVTFGLIAGARDG